MSSFSNFIGEYMLVLRQSRFDFHRESWNSIWRGGRAIVFDTTVQ